MSPVVNPRSMVYISPQEHSTNVPISTRTWEEFQPTRKSRKISTSQYARTWTDEDEAYLVKHRRHKMPYKEISNHLHKTELACRLHYHQMTSHKHRRANSNPVRPSGPRHPLDLLSPISHPGITTNAGLTTSTRTTVALGMSQDSTQAQIENSFPSIAPKLPQVNLSRPSTSTSVCPAREEIDIGRLKHVYADLAEHRKTFWTAIADAYPGDLNMSPFEIEAAFFKAQSSSPESVTWSSPSTSSVCSITPNISPMDFGCVPSTEHADTSPMHSPRPNRCTVSALLNDHELTPPIGRAYHWS